MSLREAVGPGAVLINPPGGPKAIGGSGVGSVPSPKI